MARPRSPAIPTSSFTTNTIPGTAKYSETQVKVTGEHGLGKGWALQYDLRAAEDNKTKTKKHIKTTETAFGVQDQEIGLLRGLRQGESFADALALNVVLATGSSSSSPALGVGHTAIEPDYQFGVKHQFGPRLAYGSFSIGPRIFLNSGVTQVRATADIGTKLFRNLAVFGTLFLSRTYGTDHATSSLQNPNAAEDYNLIRGGIGLRLTLTKKLRPMIEYESDLAGQSIHAGSRIVVGFSWHY